MIFPPGCARLVMSPSPRASALTAMTMGIDLVASLAAQVVADDVVTMISTLRRISSATSAGSWSTLPSANRDSIRTFRSSSRPRSRNPCRNAASWRCEYLGAILNEVTYSRRFPRLLRLDGERQGEKRARHCADKSAPIYH